MGLITHRNSIITVHPGFFHPGCGEFLASISPMRFHRIFEPRLYSVDGERLDGSNNPDLV
jgi:hypothetical protein